MSICVKLLPILILCIGNGLTLLEDNRFIIQTSTGKVRGKLEYYGDVSYIEYLGIPYAEPPFGALRFAPPVPKKAWLSIYDATANGPVCPQKEKTYKKSEMSEDCLSVNVFVPNLPVGKQRMPVMVYVPGGELDRLSGRADYIYGPQLHMARGIVVVTMNYRLGALGYLSVGTEDGSGNAGLKDVLLSLKWVKENIANFGGDPDNVTLGGNSAGAVIVHYLMLSEKSTGLFKRVILNSGSALGYRFLAKYPVENAINLCKEMGYQKNTPEELLRILWEADIFHIIAAQQRMEANDIRNGLRNSQPFVPCVENQYSHSVITREPLEIIRDGIPQNVSILAGFNAQEGLKMIPAVKENSTLLKVIKANFELAIPTNILYPYRSQESTNLADAIRNYYFGDQEDGMNSINGFINLIGDTQFYYAIDSWIKLHVTRENASDVYYYLFDFDGDLNWYKLNRNLDINGTAHADELGYSFVTNLTKKFIENAGSRSKQTMSNILDMWTNFVKYGEPTPIYLEDSSTYWEKLEHGDLRKHLILNDQPRMEYTNPFYERMNFWYEVYEQYYYYLHNGGKIEAKVVP